jgi:ABC-type transport system involved in multi-copper enzyme maturation permease subunit
MTTMTAGQSVGHTKGPTASHLIRSEYLKIRTTNTWWILALGSVLTTALALLVNCLQADQFLNSPPTSTDPSQQANLALQGDPLTIASNIYTSGQFFGGLFVMVLAILVITNEYYHQTATTTFLTTPHRTSVVAAKFVTSVIAALPFWLVATVMDIVAGLIFYNSEGVNNPLGQWGVIRAIIVNLAIYGLWAIFGIGIGVLIRSQIGATVTATLLYVVGTTIAGIIVFLIHQYLIKRDWVISLQVLIPSQAAAIATSPTKTFAESPPAWVGAAVMIGYGVVLCVIGTSIMRKRDIS